MPIVQAIRDKIAADPSIATRLGSFDQGDAAKAPAIFTGAADLNAPTTHIVITQDGGDPHEAWDTQGETVAIHIRVVGGRAGDYRNIRRIGQDIQWLLDRAELTVAGYGDIITHALTPQMIDEDWPAVDVTVTVSAFKSE